MRFSVLTVYVAELTEGCRETVTLKISSLNYSLKHSLLFVVFKTHTTR